MPLADGVDDTVAAAFGLSGVAAWSALNLRARLQAGERVLVLGAGGAVGQAAVGVAARAGRGPGRGRVPRRGGVDRARRNGADAVVTLPESGDVDELAAAMTEALDGPADVVVDPVFGWVAEAACRAMAPRGRLVNLGGSAGDAASLSSAVIRGKSLDVLGYTNNALTSEQRAEALTSVLALAGDGRVFVEHHVRPLAEVADAWSRRRHRRGPSGAGALTLAHHPRHVHRLVPVVHRGQQAEQQHEEQGVADVEVGGAEHDARDEHQGHVDGDPDEEGHEQRLERHLAAGAPRSRWRC